MSFKDQSFTQRFSAMGDEAEAVYEEVTKVWDRHGLNRPQSSMATMPPFSRYAPDYTESKRYCEVQGVGKDQLLKLKIEKLGALMMWDHIMPTDLFVWDRTNSRHCRLTMQELMTACGGGTIDTFPEGKAYIAIPLKVIETEWHAYST